MKVQQFQKKRKKKPIIIPSSSDENPLHDESNVPSSHEVPPNDFNVRGEAQHRACNKQFTALLKAVYEIQELLELFSVEG